MPLTPFRPPRKRFLLTRITPLILLVIATLLTIGCGSMTQNSQSGPASIALQNALPAATVGQVYNTVMSVTGGGAPYTFYVSAGHFPPGLALNSTTGSISGSPSVASKYVFTIGVAGGSQSSGSQTYTFNVGPASSTSKDVTVKISPLNPTVVVGHQQQFAATVTNTSNTAVRWSASAGAISSDGLFTAPAAGGSVTVAVTSAADSGVQAATTVTISKAQSAPLAISTASLPSAVAGASYDAQLAASGGQAPFAWGLASGSLPTGFQLGSTSGAITGSTANNGSFSLTVSVTDSAGHSANASYTLQVSKAGNGSNCGPPAYNCSRTDRSVAQLPTSVPRVGNLLGANTVVSDPDFHNAIARVTDFNTDPSAPLGSARTFVSTSSGSADENLWNTDSSMFLVQGDNQAAYPFTFNASTLQAARMYAGSYPSTGGLKLTDGGSWSRVDANVLYEMPGTQIVKLDFSNRSTPPTPQVVFDFTTCLPRGFVAAWSDRGGVSAGDTTFAMSFSNGSQGTGIYAAVYRAGSGCTLLNTQTGQVTGDWGAKGSINVSDRWTIHNAKLSKDGNWLIITSQACKSSHCTISPYFWQVGTTNVTACGDAGQCGGHWTEGYTHWVNNDNSPLGNQVIRPFAAASVQGIMHNLPSALTTPFDQHQSWNNADANDNNPFLTSTWSDANHFPAPWYNEVLGVATDGSGTVWRFAHTFISVQSQEFSPHYAIGSVSQDGRFFLLSSDWMGTLGSESGTASCKLGKDCRGDVFVVQLN